MLSAVTIRSQMNFVQERMNMEEEGEEEVDEEMEKVQAVEEEKEDDVATYLSVTSRLSLSGKPIENSFLDALMSFSRLLTNMPFLARRHPELLVRIQEEFRMLLVSPLVEWSSRRLH